MFLFFPVFTLQIFRKFTCQSKSTKIDTELSPEEEALLVGHDISRLPPRVWRAIPLACESLIKEINDLTTKDNTGHPALLEVGL